MKEPSTPRATYDGSLKELAKAHVGLVKALLFFLIITIPASAVCIFFSQHHQMRHIVTYEDEQDYERAWLAWQKEHNDPKMPFYGLKSPEPGIPQIKSSFPGVIAINPEYLYVPTAYSDLLIGCAKILAVFLILHGIGNLLCWFHRLSTLLYSHVAWYLTVLVLVPGVNLLVILALWRSGLKQMRGRGLQVGIFGIDPAKVAA